MEQMQQTFAILGGDLRQTYLAKKFLEQGFLVSSYGMKKESSLEGVVVKDQLEEAIVSSNHVILPIPFTHDHSSIYHEGNKKDMEIAELMKYIQKGQHLFGGCLSEELKEHCKNIGVLYTDFMEEDRVAIYNTVATAEGIIAEAIMSYPKNLQGNKALVLGYGKCAKVLAKKLKALDVTVTVVARNEKQILWAKTDGYHTCFLEDLSEIIDTASLIFNTVPNHILTDG
ncbi:MAG TPA: dipicolinate synthase, partial [Candidatus Merdenecus merdavium]|nr:dipicolinate synthase [Candidatus Merdenecus merdavium]